MSYLVDTCVISELVKPRPAPAVVDWLDAVPSEALHLSVLSLGEIRRGVEKLPPGTRREKIAVWLEMELPAWFEDRVLPIDADVADEWARLAVRTGRTLPAIDALLAATCLRHRLTMVTRNVQDFAGIGLDIIDPWSAARRQGK